MPSTDHSSSSRRRSPSHHDVNSARWQRSERSFDGLLPGLDVCRRRDSGGVRAFGNCEVRGMRDRRPGMTVRPLGLVGLRFPWGHGAVGMAQPTRGNESRGRDQAGWGWCGRCSGGYFSLVLLVVHDSSSNPSLANAVGDRASVRASGARVARLTYLRDRSRNAKYPLLLFAAPKLPAMARSLGQSIRIMQSEVKEMKADDGAAGTEATSPKEDAAVQRPPAPPVGSGSKIS